MHFAWVKYFTYHLVPVLAGIAFYLTLSTSTSWNSSVSIVSDYRLDDQATGV
jgi:hypothetical protein